MIKRLQNRISESRLALPVTAIYAACVWMAAGLIHQQWWMQFGCFVLSTYLMVELNNSNALIRIYSRMVSCSFLVVSASAVFLFGSLQGAVIQLTCIGTLSFLFKCYQDRKASGLTFGAFFCMGLASMMDIQVLCYLPFVWLLMALYIQSLSWRTFGASIIGVLVPYWFLLPFALFRQQQERNLDHFAGLFRYGPCCHFGDISEQQWLTLAFVLLIGGIGAAHYLRSSYKDKIRIRQLYGCFIILGGVTLFFFILQPQKYELLIHMLIINATPLIAHYIALTNTRLTNIVFMVITAMALLLTGYNLLTPFLAAGNETFF